MKSAGIEEKVDTTYTIRDLADICGCSVSELNMYLIESGLISEVIKDGKRHIVNRSTAKKVTSHFYSPQKADGKTVATAEKKEHPQEKLPKTPTTKEQLRKNQAKATVAKAQPNKNQAKATAAKAEPNKNQAKVTVAKVEPRATQTKPVEPIQQPIQQTGNVKASPRSTQRSNDEIVNELILQLDVMRKQLEVKDKQIESLLQQIESLTNTTKALSEANVMSTVADKMMLHPELAEKQSFWKRIFG